MREIKGLAVAPRFQRQGVGRALVEAAIAEARADGARKLTLRVLGDNAPAHALYKACGFVEEGNLRGLFLLDGTYVDDVLFSLDLTSRRLVSVDVTVSEPGLRDQPHLVVPAREPLGRQREPPGRVHRPRARSVLTSCRRAARSP